jgi:phage terminase large subunit GpA-like protein
MGLYTPFYIHAGEWAANCRRITRAESSEPGNFDYKKTPFMKPIYEAVESGKYRRVVIACGAQNSKTETCLNILGHRLDTKPVPSVIVLPSKDLSKTFSKKRVSKLIENSTLKEKCSYKNDNVFEKVVNGHFLSFAWSTSPTTMCSSPYGFALLDELDRFEADSRGEGDPVTLVEARGTTFPDFIMICNSTPTIEDTSAIAREFEKGTKQRLHFVCLNCKQAFLPILENLKWERDQPWTAHLLCPHCEHKMYDKDRTTLIENYVYLSDSQTYENSFVQGTLPDLTVASFWIYGLASPWKSFVDRATLFYEAAKKKDQFEIQAVVNTAFGQLFRIKTEKPDVENVFACKLDYGNSQIPQGVQALLASVDVQKDRFYYVVRGYALGGQESWLIEWGEIFGDTEDPNTWKRLTEQVLKKKYLGVGTNTLYNIQQVFIDSGYRAYVVYDYCLKSQGFCLPAKGRDVLKSPVATVGITHNDKSFKLFHINDGFFKEKIHGEIRKAEKKWHLCREVNEQYANSILAEGMVIKANGLKHWIKLAERNDYLDCEKMAEALAHYLGILNPKTVQNPNRPRVISKGVNS